MTGEHMMGALRTFLLLTFAPDYCPLKGEGILFKNKNKILLFQQNLCQTLNLHR